MATLVAPTARPADAYAPPDTLAAPHAALPTHARAVVFEAPGALDVRDLALRTPGDADVVVDAEWTGVSAGTERLLWRGTMPAFPGLGYPLVPGYETVGRVRRAGPSSGRQVGERVFLPGSYSFTDARNLFGGAGATLVAPGTRAHPVGESLGEEAVLLALAATALHAVRDAERPKAPLPDLIVGHGALGRVAARLVVALGGPAPTVWEVAPERAAPAGPYAVVHPDADPRRDYRRVCDLSGDARLLDALVARLAPGGELVLGGFYTAPLALPFIPAFLRGLRLRVASEWSAADLANARDLAASGQLPLGGIVTHRARAGGGRDAVAAAYATAFDDPACVKLVLDWRPSA